MATAINWLTIFSNFVRRHPRTSATIAFNLGVIAARATRGKPSIPGGVAEIPAKLIELVPSMADLGTYVPHFGERKKQPRGKDKRTTAARKPVGSKPVTTRNLHRKAGQKTAARVHAARRKQTPLGDAARSSEASPAPVRLLPGATS